MAWLVDPSPEDPIALEELLVDEVVEVAAEELLPEEEGEEEEGEEEEDVGALKREVAARKADELDGGALRELELWPPDEEDEGDEEPLVVEEELGVEVVEEPPVLREAAVLMDPRP